MHNLTKIRLFRIVSWLVYPFALLFVYPFSLLKRKNKGHLFFFFDRYAIGGAQRIHLDILESVAGLPKQLYFTRAAEDHSLKEAFFSVPNTEASDIHFWCDNLLFRLFTIHFYAFYINRHGRSHVFSANSTFFYDMLPFLKKRVVTTELLHNFTGGKRGMEYFGLANVRLLDNRIVYDSYTLNNIRRQYEEYGIPESCLDRIKFIEPGVEIPATMPIRENALPLKVLYAGRGGAQKRIWLLDRVAARCYEQGLPVVFHFAGTMTDELSEPVKAASVIHGRISGKEAMSALYAACDALLMTSAYEGFPMAIKESMAQGCVPVVTALEGNKMHLTHLQNALLIESIEDEEQVVEQGFRNLQMLVSDSELRISLQHAAYTYAAAHFNRKCFMKEYRDFLS
jgi:glycosyltransferase involved in cell wall biosynthesis